LSLWSLLLYELLFLLVRWLVLEKLWSLGHFDHRELAAEKQLLDNHLHSYGLQVCFEPLGALMDIIEPSMWVVVIEHFDEVLDTELVVRCGQALASLGVLLLLPVPVVLLPIAKLVVILTGAQD
jgi:hypothetical protein